jgi:DNA-binding transcriptional MocR family regulator
VGFELEERRRTEGKQTAMISGVAPYNKTNGIINDLITGQLAADEGIAADPESIIVTTGCQKGMAILLLGLIDPATDARSW